MREILGTIVLVALVVLAVRAMIDLWQTNRRKFGMIIGFIVLMLLLFTVGGGLSLGDIFGSLTGDNMDDLRQMFGTVVLSVVFCIGIWVFLNFLMGTISRGWAIFAGLTGTVIGAAFFGVLRGNRSVLPIFADEDPIQLLSGGGFLGNAEWPVIGAILFGGGAYAMAIMKQREVRIAIGAGVGIVAGLLIANYVKVWHRPDIDWVNTIIATVIGAAVLGGARVRRGDPIPGALLGAGFGFATGAWLLSEWGEPNKPWVAAIIPLALLGAGVGYNGEPSKRQVAALDNRARAAIFLGPALIFLSIALVIPAIRTVILSFKDRTSENNVGFDNYERLFTESDSFDTDNWADMFTSNLFFWAVFLVIAGILIGMVTGWRRDGSPNFEASPTSIGALGLAAFFFAFAALSVLRGTFFNNLWWVITVVTVATILGLTIAVLADRASIGENAAKSMIFMPMAISFVGASIVWRLQYEARPVSKSQTGVLNSIWVALGDLSNSTGPRIVVLIVLGAILAFIIYRAIPKIRNGDPFTGAAILTALLGYLFYRLAVGRVGGYGEGQDATVFFLTNQPFNNVFLMIIMIWMQTGFAMVILSAALKAVPTEFIEAARVDGASESQTFFRVTLPQILPTVGVVVTTMIVQVTKVYDIVKVAGQGGNFGNNVLANAMFDQSFSFGNFGFGAAIAVVMFLTVLPVMIYNIRSMQKAQV